MVWLLVLDSDLADKTLFVLMPYIRVALTQCLGLFTCCKILFLSGTSPWDNHIYPPPPKTSPGACCREASPQHATLRPPGFMEGRGCVCFWLCGFGSSAVAEKLEYTLFVWVHTKKQITLTIIHWCNKLLGYFFVGFVTIFIRFLSIVC